MSSTALAATPPLARPAATSRLPLLAAFGVVYVVWGSTFLGIKVAVETIPPLAMPATRFLVSGLVLLAVAWRPLRAATLRQWRDATILGALFFFGNHALVSSAASRMPSALASILIATEVPVIAVLSSLLLPGHPLTRRALLGGAVGIAGVAALVLGTGGVTGGALLVPSLMVLGASLTWSLGVVISQRLDAPGDAILRAGMQMTTGGALLAIASLVRGEPAQLLAHGVSQRSLVALVYLVVFGSILAFGCFTWLLGKVPPSTLATHVFVNPLVAVVLGAWLAGERLLPVHLVGGALILASVMIVTGAPRAPRAGSEQRTPPALSPRLRRGERED